MVDRDPLQVKKQKQGHLLVVLHLYFNSLVWVRVSTLEAFHHIFSSGKASKRALLGYPHQVFTQCS